MTRIFNLLAFLLFSVIVSAQPASIPASIKWSNNVKEPSGTYISKIVGTTGNGFYALRERVPGKLLSSKTEKIYIESYSSEMKLRKSAEIELQYKNKNLDFEDLILLGNDLYLLSSFNNQGKKKNYLFVQQIRKKGLRPDRNLRKIGEIDTRNKEREGSFNYHISRDSSKLLMYSQLPYKKKSPERFSLRVFDNTFNEIWSKEITLPYNDEVFSAEEYRVDNKGNVYLLGVVYSDRSRTRRQGKPTYQYVILAYTQNGEQLEEYKISLGDKFITDLTFRVADDGNLVCAGFYSEVGTYSIKGTYFFRLNAETKIIYKKNLKEFNFDFVTEYMSERKREKARAAEARGDKRKQAELYQYSLDDLILRSDGGALMVAEQFFVEEQQFNDFNSFNRFQNVRTDFLYNYNDIIVVNINPDGSIQWTTRIPKNQETYNDGGYFSSYAMSIVRDKIYFVYNDNGRNFGPNNRDRIYGYNGKNSVIALAELKRDGSLNTYPLYSNRDAEVIARPKICKQIGKNEMAIYGEWGRSYKFGHLIFRSQ